MKKMINRFFRVVFLGTFFFALLVLTPHYCRAGTEVESEKPLSLVTPATTTKPDNSRTLEVVYNVRVDDELPDEAEKLRVWVPMPPDGPFQQILDMKITCPVPYTINHDVRWGNRAVYIEFEPGNIKMAFEFTMSFTVVRREHRVVIRKDDVQGVPATEPFRQYLEPSTYAVHNKTVERMSNYAVEGKSTTLEKSRAIYDFVLENMNYNKSVPGWGKGDVNRVCLAIGGGGKGTGNCTDFHSFFGSLMHVQGIPVVFEMGFPFKPDASDAVKGGYHCWAKFFLPGIGWTPVDISEADKDPTKTDYYFGAIDENRVLFSRGRDILLSPPQEGERLNFFGPDPYMELDGKAFKGFERTIEYRDVKKNN